MVSSKGKPTDPKLREEAKEGQTFSIIPWQNVVKCLCTDAQIWPDVKQMTNKDGSGKGQMAAWKVSSFQNDNCSRATCRLS